MASIYAMRHESNTKGIAFMEAILMPTPSWDMVPAEPRKNFQAFRTPEVSWDMLVKQNMFIERILPGSIIRNLTEEEMNHYREPFKDPAHRKPVWRWPNELPVEGKPADVEEAVNNYSQKLLQSELPKLLIYGTPGALITAPVVEMCRQNMMNLKTVDIGQGRHYLQEDNPHLIGSELATWYSSL